MCEFVVLVFLEDVHEVLETFFDFFFERTGQRFDVYHFTRVRDVVNNVAVIKREQDGKDAEDDEVCARGFEVDEEAFGDCRNVTRVLHQQSDAQEGQNSVSAHNTVHSLFAGNHRVDDAESDGKEEIGVRDFKSEHGNHCEHIGREKDKFLTVAFLEVQRAHVDCKHEYEQQVENGRRTAETFLVECYHSVETERVVDENLVVRVLVYHHLETVEGVFSEVVDCHGKSEKICQHEGTDKSEDNDCAVLAELFEACVVTVVHITHISNRERCECQCSEVEDCGERHEEINEDIAFLDKAQDCSDHERNEQRFERSRNTAHNEGNGQQRIKCGEENGDTVACVFSSVEVNHRNHCHIREHSDQTDKHGHADRSQILSHCTDYRENINRAGRHSGKRGAVICINIAYSVLCGFACDVDERSHFTAETVHRKQEYKPYDKGCKHKHSGNKPTVLVPHGRSRDCGCFVCFAFCGFAACGDKRCTACGAVKVDESVGACIGLSDKHKDRHDESNSEQSHKGDEQNSADVLIVTCNLGHLEFGDGCAFGNGGRVNLHHRNVVVVRRTDGSFALLAE